MQINLTHEENNSTIDQTLYYAQIISEAFTNSLDKNQCNIKVVLSLSQEIVDETNSLEEIYNYSRNPIESIISYSNDSTNYSSIDQAIKTDIENRVSQDNAQSIIEALKESCIDCKFSFPKLDINSHISYSFDKLRLLLNLYKDTFKKLANPNLCHVSNSFSYACIPSIISLIVLLLEAYATLLALRKVGNLSLNVFLKGVISGLVGTLLGSLSIKLDTSNTGIKCLIDAIKEIANQLETEVNGVKYNIIPTEALNNLGYNSSDYSSTKEEIWDNESFSNVYGSMDQAKQKYIDEYLNKLEQETSAVDKSISSAFNTVSDTLETVTNNLRDTTEGLFGLLDYFQCESERSGTGFSDLLYDMDKILQLVNLLSAILSIIAKKQIKKLCKTKQSINQMITTIETTAGDPLTELEQVEVISEYLGKVVEITKDKNDNIVPIIYDKDKDTILPKLSFYSCNLKEIIEAHSIDNVVNEVLKEIAKEEIDYGIQEEEVTDKYEIERGSINPVLLPDSYVVDKNKWNIYPIKYEKYTLTPEENNNTNRQISNILRSEDGRSTSIQSILDLIYNNPSSPKKEENNNSNSTTIADNVSTGNDDYHDKLKKSVPNATEHNQQKKSFNAKCRDISDVLEKLKELQLK